MSAADQFVETYDGHLSCLDGAWVGARGPNATACLDGTQHLISTTMSSTNTAPPTNLATAEARNDVSALGA